MSKRKRKKPKMAPLSVKMTTGTSVASSITMMMPLSLEMKIINQKRRSHRPKISKSSRKKSSSVAPESATMSKLRSVIWAMAAGPTITSRRRFRRASTAHLKSSLVLITTPQLISGRSLAQSSRWSRATSFSNPEKATTTTKMTTTWPR